MRWKFDTEAFREDARKLGLGIVGGVAVGIVFGKVETIAAAVVLCVAGLALLAWALFRPEEDANDRNGV